MALFRRSSSRSFADVFDETYASLLSEAGHISDRWELMEWTEGRFPDYSYPGPRATALEWRTDEITDAQPSTRDGNISSRVNRIWRSFLVVEEFPDAATLFVRLGEQLHDSGLLHPPYDEFADFGPDVHRKSGQPLNPDEPGPGRLAALITLAGYANRTNHPRSPEWTNEVRRGVETFPVAVAVLTEPPRNLLTELGISS